MCELQNSENCKQYGTIKMLQWINTVWIILIFVGASQQAREVYFVIRNRMNNFFFGASLAGSLMRLETRLVVKFRYTYEGNISSSQWDWIHRLFHIWIPSYVLCPRHTCSCPKCTAITCWTSSDKVGLLQGRPEIQEEGFSKGLSNRWFGLGNTG